MSEPKPPGFDLSGVQLLATALHAQLLAGRRATLEHDIKNVMHGLLSGTELLAKSLSTASARITPAECLALLQQQLGRAQSTLATMLDEVAPAAQASSDIDIADLVSDCAHALRHQLQGFKVHNTVQQGLRTHAMRAHLKDVLLLVLLDCIDRSPSRSAITLDAAGDGASVTLTIGHAAAPTSDASVVTATTPLLEAYGARLSISNSPTQRSIAIVLPQIAVATAAALDVVIVDTNRDAADSAAMLVQLDNLTAEARYDNESTVDLVRSRAPRLIVVDLDGNFDSAGLVRTLRNLPGARPRIAGLSYSAAAQADVDASLRKPLDVASLRRLLE